MNLAAFLDTRSADWERLDGLLTKARGRADRLGAAGVREVGGLYRAAQQTSRWPVGASPGTRSSHGSRTSSPGGGRWCTAPGRGMRC